MNSHRQKFRKSDFAKNWNSVVDSAQFQSAATSAMLHFLDTFKPCDGIESAAANEYRRQGASAFLQTLQNLNSETETSKPNERDNLR